MAEFAAETDRLVLRDWGPGDADAFYAVMNTPAVMRHLGGIQAPDEWEAAHQRLQGYSQDFGHTFWIVEARETGELLGFCGLKRVNSPGAGDLAGECEIGWRLRESAWGLGIAKEAAIASLDLCFGKFGYDRVVALTIPANRQSEGLMQRLGMVRRADLDFIDTRFGPEMNPCIVYELRAGDWSTARQQALGRRS